VASPDGQALTPRLAEQSGDQEGSQVQKCHIFERERHLTPLRVGGQCLRLTLIGTTP
jgi:hypothetical protein